MGARSLTEAVVDAGPLIHLHEVGALDLLAVLDRLHVPDAVWHEAFERHHVPEAAVHRQSMVIRHDVAADLPRFAARPELAALHRGELECLLVCTAGGPSTLLTDDLAVRRVAKSLGLTPVGSLGVVVRAYRDGEIDVAAAEARIERLYSVSSLYVTRAIVELAIAKIREWRES